MGLRMLAVKRARERRRSVTAQMDDQAGTAVKPQRIPRSKGTKRTGKSWREVTLPAASFFTSTRSW